MLQFDPPALEKDPKHRSMRGHWRMRGRSAARAHKAAECAQEAAHWVRNRGCCKRESCRRGALVLCFILTFTRFARDDVQC